MQAAHFEGSFRGGRRIFRGCEGFENKLPRNSFRNKFPGTE
jgi:hypothetical protein